MTVHVRVNDAATGKPTPARLRIAGPRDEYFAPFGRVAEFPVGRNEDVGGSIYLDGKRHTYIDGSCEIHLPTGVPLDIEITKGLEYKPIRTTTTLGAGQMALRFVLERWTNRVADHWLSADTRCHFLPPHAALLEGMAEDVDLAHLLATEQDYPSQDGHLYRTIANMTAFSGQSPALETAGHAVVVNTFNTHPALGRLGLLNCHRPVYPLSFGRHEEGDDWSLCDWADQCHRKKGLAVWCDAYRPEAGLPGGEALVAAILGRIDGLEIDGRDRTQPFLPLWYRLLNAGIGIPIVAGSGKESNRVAIGSMRTYTLMEDESRGLADWVERTRAGRTFITNGPLLDFRVNGRCVGSTVATTAGEKIAIHAQAISQVPFEYLEIVANGVVVAQAGPGSPLEIEHSLPKGGWVVARCRGKALSELDRRSPLLAHTSPIHVRITDRPPPVAAAAVDSLRRDIEATRLWVERDGRFALEKRKAQLLERCDEALRVLAERIAGR